ncbi:MAG: Fic family protein [Hyphomicrobiales bacterium]|nr:Fic family protein [Hyphomicrobiales bacterium]
MTEKLLHTMPEVFVSTAETTVMVSRAVKSGELRKLASRLYTKNFTDAPEAIVKRHIWQIVSGYFPGALVADRTALENAPAKDGSICLITDKGGDITLPGITLRPRRGAAPLPNDLPFISGLFISSTARAYLENMRVSRGRGDTLPRTLTKRELEEKLDTLIRRSGEDAINKLRDEVRNIAPTLAMKKEAKAFDELVGTLLGTRKAALQSPAAKARKSGHAYDPERLVLFQSLHTELRNSAPVTRLAKKRNPQASATLAFFESYFSNFIEGTEFEVQEAADIVFKGVIPNERPEDAHDVLGTWRLVSSEHEMHKTPKNLDTLTRLLKSRHAAIMEQRPDKQPGKFKQSGNRAGSTTFVAPELVEGTLKVGFELYQSLETPFQRAVFMMFLISEVHPFADGNGRTARIMMNAELVAAGEERIIIPTVYRSNYLSALKALSQGGHPTPLVRTLDFGQKWVAAVDWGALEATEKQLAQCNAFLDPTVADEEGKRLRLPAHDD